MSYILDALKKSEQERQENQAPTVHSVYPGSRFSKEKSSTPWLMIVLLISIISGFIVSGFWWYSYVSQPVFAKVVPPKPLPESEAAADNHDADKVKNNRVVMPATNKTVTETPQPDKVASPVIVTDSNETIVDNEPVLLPVMQLAELPDDVRSSMPPMNYSFHVYSTDKTKCTIIINNRRYREGELIGAGWLLDSITETGIVVRKDRYRAAIQVVDNW